MNLNYGKANDVILAFAKWEQQGISARRVHRPRRRSIQQEPRRCPAPKDTDAPKRSQTKVLRLPTRGESVEGGGEAVLD